MKNLLLFKAVICLIIASILFDTSYIYVYAGDVNESEQRILDLIAGTFEVDGITYKAESWVLNEARGYLSSYDVDLTDGQVSRLIQYFYENIHIAISEHYLVPVLQEESPDNGGDSDDGSNNSGSTDSSGDSIDSGTALPADDYQISEGSKGQDSLQGGSSDVDDGLVQDGSGQDAAYQNDEAVKGAEAFEEDGSSGRTSQGGDDGSSVLAASTIDGHIDNSVINGILNQIDDIEGGFEDSKLSGEAVKDSNGLRVVYVVLIGGSTVLLLGIIIILFRHYIYTYNMKKKNLIKKHELNEQYVDIHAHILPGVDDGPKDMEETVRVLRASYEQGIRTIIATPHYHVGRKTTPERLMEITSEVSKEAEKIDKDFKIYLGNEIYYEKGCLEALVQKRACTMAGSRYVLVEFSLEESYKEIYDGMRDFVMEGYIPIIAHAERFHFLFSNKERIRSMVKLGCYIQVNADSIRSGFLHSRASYVRKLIIEGLVHFIATDCHNTDGRSPNMEKGLDSLRKYADEGIINRLVVINPSKIIAKKYI